MSNSEKKLPLAGIKVLAFTHAVMGPSAGLVLADLGAEVIHIEQPPGTAFKSRYVNHRYFRRDVRCTGDYYRAV